jgi:MFS transporter, AAHS family, 4-hydroxybenzoate transporter
MEGSKETWEAFGRGKRFWALGLCILVTTLDGYDTQAIAFSAPAISDAFGSKVSDLAPAVTTGVLGMALGAVLCGALGDRIGRKNAVISTTALFGLFSLLCATSDSVLELSVYRFLAGLGLGGATPNVLALAGEIASPARRPFMMFVAGLGLPGGAIVGGGLGTLVIPKWGWEGVFLIGGVVPLLAVPILVLAFPESPAFAARKTFSSFAERGLVFRGRAGRCQYPIIRLLSPNLRGVTLSIWAVYFFNWIAWYAILLWQPSVFSVAFDRPNFPSLATIVINVSALATLMPLAIFLPKLPLRGTVLFLIGCGLISMGGLMASLTTGAACWAFSFIALCGFGVGGPQLVLNYVAAEVYDTELRSTGIGAAIGLGRIGSVVGGALGGGVLGVAGLQGFYCFIVIFLGGAFVASLFLKIGPQRKSA